MSTTSERWTERVHKAYVDRLGDAVRVDESFGPLGVDVPADRWVESIELARSTLGCGFFDWLSAVDELADGFRVVCHLAAHRPGSVDHLLVRTLVAREDAVLTSVSHLFAGARWHERETHEMFGVDFTVDGLVLDLEPLLLPSEFEGHPLRKEFVLASRVAKQWPGAKETGESDHQAAPSRRRTRPPGVPNADQWGPREPGSQQPDPLAVASAGTRRPRRPPRPLAGPDAGGRPSAGAGSEGDG